MQEKCDFGPQQILVVIRPATDGLEKAHSWCKELIRRVGSARDCTFTCLATLDGLEKFATLIYSDEVTLIPVQLTLLAFQAVPFEVSCEHSALQTGI